MTNSASGEHPTLLQGLEEAIDLLIAANNTALSNIRLVGDSTYGLFGDGEDEVCEVAPHRPSAFELSQRLISIAKNVYNSQLKLESYL